MIAPGMKVRLTQDNLGAYHSDRKFGVGDKGVIEGAHPIIPEWFDVIMDGAQPSGGKFVVPVHTSQFEVIA